MLALQIIVFLLGLMIILGTLYSAIKQTILPGRKRVGLSRVVFRNIFRLFRLVAVRIQSRAISDAIMGLFAPISAMLLPFTWVILLILGFTALFWAAGVSSPGTAMALSGAALTTEGFLAPNGTAQTILYIIEGGIGLGIVGLFITFLPTIYSVYSQREQEVTRVALRFGAPPSGVKVLAQSYRSGLIQELDHFWKVWEEWFSDMAETHISNIAVLFYRSPRKDTSWITTAGAILDASSLFSSTVDRQDDPWLNLCFKAGCDTLVDIAADVSIKSVPGLASNGSIHVTRAEYDVAYEQLRSVGVLLKADREASWRAFVSMRSQYDIPLLVLADLVFAPKAPWSSDRKIEPVKRKQR